MSEPTESPSSSNNSSSPVVRVLEICNKKGLHARASAKFVQTVEKFDANVRVTRNGETVGGDSIMGLMMLAAGPGTTISVEATGADAAAVVEALAALTASAALVFSAPGFATALAQAVSTPSITIFGGHENSRFR